MNLQQLPPLKFIQFGNATTRSTAVDVGDALEKGEVDLDLDHYYMGPSFLTKARFAYPFTSVDTGMAIVSATQTPERGAELLEVFDQTSVSLVLLTLITLALVFGYMNRFVCLSMSKKVSRLFMLDLQTKRWIWQGLWYHWGLS